MLATRIRQKDGTFYFVSYPAKDILARVRFISRFYGEGEQIAAQVISQSDEIAQFIARIEHSDAAFQRQLSRAKVRALKNFYEMAVNQPPIPGTVLLFTHERLSFQPLASEQSVGNLRKLAVLPARIRRVACATPPVWPIVAPGNFSPGRRAPHESRKSDGITTG